MSLIAYGGYLFCSEMSEDIDHHHRIYSIIWWLRDSSLVKQRLPPSTTLLRLINLVSCLRDSMPFLAFCQNKQPDRKPLLVQRCEKFMGNINIHDIHSRQEDGNIPPPPPTPPTLRCTWLPLHLKAVKNHRCVCASPDICSTGPNTDSVRKRSTLKQQRQTSAWVSEAAPWLCDWIFERYRKQVGIERVMGSSPNPLMALFFCKDSIYVLNIVLYIWFRWVAKPELFSLRTHIKIMCSMCILLCSFFV